MEHTARVDAMLAELNKIAEQDKTIGPCMAYEKLTLMLESDDRYGDDRAFCDALRTYENKAYDFVRSIKEGEESERRSEYGSALSSFYRAQCIYPNSELAHRGAERVTKIIVSARY